MTLDIFTTTILPTIISNTSEILSQLVIIAIGIAGTWLMLKMKNNNHLQAIAKATDEVIKTAQITTGELQQTYVNAWKNAQNGKLTDEQKLQLRQNLIDMTIEKLSPEVTNLLTSAKADVLGLITGVSEDLINRMKNGDISGQ